MRHEIEVKKAPTTRPGLFLCTMFGFFRYSVGNVVQLVKFGPA
jgi:hypothetical protein